MGSSHGWEGMGFGDRRGFRLSSGPNSHNRSKLPSLGASQESLSTETGSSSQGHRRTAAGSSSPPGPLCSVIRCSELLRTQAASGLRNSHPNQRRPPFYKTPQHEAANPMHLAQETSRIPKSKMQPLLLQVGVAALPCAVSIPRTALPAKAGRCS